jgi:hypothetical protein
MMGWNYFEFSWSPIALECWNMFKRKCGCYNFIFGSWDISKPVLEFVFSSGHWTIICCHLWPLETLQTPMLVAAKTGKPNSTASLPVTNSAWPKWEWWDFHALSRRTAFYGSREGPYSFISFYDFISFIRLHIP